MNLIHVFLIIHGIAKSSCQLATEDITDDLDDKNTVFPLPGSIPDVNPDDYNWKIFQEILSTQDELDDTDDDFLIDDSEMETNMELFLEKKKLAEKLKKLKLDCLRKQKDEALSEEQSGKCRTVWDTLLCWPSTAPNSTVILPCPDFVPEFSAQGTASKTCTGNGTWAKDPSKVNLSMHVGWTNYSGCMGSDLPEFIVAWLPTIKLMSIIGYSVSLVTLVISFAILASLRKLRCPRNLLHLHLFASFIFRASVVLVKSSVLVDGTGIGGGLALQEGLDEKNLGTWACKFMIGIWQYFIVANYSWILMEGLYLYNLIFMALFTDSSAITMYILLGWGLPLGFVSLWSILRICLENTHCWTINKVKWLFWLCIRGPVALSNVINFFFFVNVTRVLYMKLKSSVSAESMKYRKFAKSTLVLVPLFGVHYCLLIGLSTSTNDYVELAWLIIDQVFASMQGFFVAILYCLMNGEVRQELRKHYNNHFKDDTFLMTSHSTMITRTYHRAAFLQENEQSEVTELRPCANLIDLSSNCSSDTQDHNYEGLVQVNVGLKVPANSNAELNISQTEIMESPELCRGEDIVEKDPPLAASKDTRYYQQEKQLKKSDSSELLIVAPEPITGNAPKETVCVNIKPTSNGGNSPSVNSYVVKPNVKVGETML